MATKLLSVDGKSYREAQDTTPPFTAMGDFATLHNKLSATLQLVRPEERVGGLAAEREAERARAPAKVDSAQVLEPVSPQQTSTTWWFACVDRRTAMAASRPSTRRIRA